MNKYLIAAAASLCATAAYAAEKYVEKIKGMEYPGG